MSYKWEVLVETGISLERLHSADAEFGFAHFLLPIYKTEAKAEVAPAIS